MSEVATLDTNWAAAKAREIGFDLCGVAPAEDLVAPEHLADWLARGFAGEMRYLHNPRRGNLTSVVPEARSVIVCALNYDQPVPYSIQEAVSIPNPTGGRADGADWSPNEEDSPRGWISRYAWGDDYHDVLGEKLELLVAALREKFGDQFAARAYVDTGPISERAAAKVAGIGWLGKNTCLINKDIGSWLFLGVIITSLEIADYEGADFSQEAREGGADRKEGEIPRRGLLGMTGTEKKDKKGNEKERKEKADPFAASLPRDDSQVQMEGEGTNAKGTSTDGLDERPLTGPGEEPQKNFGSGLDRLGRGGDKEPQNSSGIRARPLNQLAPDLCGNCTMCLDACPTGALVEPYVMDARRCISYLTIELRGSIPEEFRRDIGWQVFGCDICQDVCPWNRDGGSAARTPVWSAGPDAEPGGLAAAFAPRAGLAAPELEWLLALTEADFREMFRGSPVKRTKWRGLIRNACVAAGNAQRKQGAAGGAVASDGAFGRAHGNTPEGASQSNGNGAQEHSALRARLAELAASDDAVIAEHARWALNQ